jgi:NarL family two-component system response regulator YdfI
MPTPATVLVIADEALVAARIEAMLRGDSRWRVAVGRASDPAASIAHHAPAAVILALASDRATRILDRLEEPPPLPPLVLLTGDVRAAWTPRARRTRLRAVLGAQATADEVKAALVAALAGLIVLHPDALGSSAAPARGATAAPRGISLTGREIEILELMAEGLGNRRIAARLGISRHTVKFHVTSILDKLGVTSRTEAVTRSIREGRISV